MKTYILSRVELLNDVIDQKELELRRLRSVIELHKLRRQSLLSRLAVVESQAQLEEQRT
jgi:hypothetical protein